MTHVTAGAACGRTTMATMSPAHVWTPPTTCSPPSTTSASPCPTSTPRSPSTATTFGMRLAHQETNEEQGVREAMMAVGDSGSCIQLLAPLDEESTIAKFLDRNGPGHPAAGLPGHRRRGGQRDPARARPAAAVRRAAARHVGLAGSTSSTPRTPAACWSSSSSRPTPDRPDPLRPLDHTAVHSLLLVGNVPHQRRPTPT